MYFIDRLNLLAKITDDETSILQIERYAGLWRVIFGPHIITGANLDNLIEEILNRYAKR